MQGYVMDRTFIQLNVVNTITIPNYGSRWRYRARFARFRARDVCARYVWGRRP